MNYRYLLAPLAAVLLASPHVAQAQTGGVGIGTTAPDASAALDIVSSSKGLLPPRLTQAQRDAIASPAAGLTIFNTTTNRLNTWNGTSWDQALSATETPISASPRTFSVPGQYSYIVPVGILSLTVDVSGGRGGGNTNNPGGLGARVLTTLSVTPGETLVLNVGGAGQLPPIFASGGGGFNGGGAGSSGNGGGGASDIRRGSTRVVVAGGGGGGGMSGFTGIAGGNGGTPDGQPGVGGVVGGGGTSTGPGAGAGSRSGNGGNGGNGNGNNGSCGGGGGYFGGGAGGADGVGGGAGGGGSSYVAPTGNNGGSYGTSSTTDGSITLTPGTFVAQSVSNVPGDNLGNHTATQNLNLATYQLVGNGGSTGLTISSTGNVGLGTTAADPTSQKLDVRGNLRLGTDGGYNATGVGQALEWVGPGVNTDPVGLYRANPASDQSELRVVVGDAADPNDKFAVGRMPGTSTEGGIPTGTFVPTFVVNAAGQVSVPGLAGTGTRALGADASGNLTTTAVPGDNLGNHLATQNLNLGTNALVGNGGTVGLTLSSAGNAAVAGSVQVPAASAYTYAAPKAYTATYGAADFQLEVIAQGNSNSLDGTKTFYLAGTNSNSEDFALSKNGRAALHLPQGATLVSATITYFPSGGTFAIRSATLPAPGTDASTPPTPTTLGSVTLTNNSALTRYLAATITLPAGTVVDNTKAYYLWLGGPVEAVGVRLTYTISQVE